MALMREQLFYEQEPVNVVNRYAIMADFCVIHASSSKACLLDEEIRYNSYIYRPPTIFLRCS